MRIDLRQNLKGTFSNHQSYVYPLSIASNSAVYDTLYLTDYLLKHIYRILMAIIINGADKELIKQETYLIMSASISYEDIKYTLEDNILTFKKLKEKINIVCWKDDEYFEIPSYAKYLQQFFREYYDDIKNVFPIYNRLENIYRLCALNVVLDNFTTETEIHESIYVDTYPRSILCSDGIVLAPKNLLEHYQNHQHQLQIKLLKFVELKED